MRGKNFVGHSGVRAQKACATCGIKYEGGPNKKYCGMQCKLLAFRKVRGACWEWTGARDSEGYGKMAIYIEGKRVNRIVHRLAYEAFHCVAVPDGKLVCHHCDNPPCFNPEHLFVGTVLDNNRDKAAKGRARGNRKLALTEA